MLSEDDTFDRLRRPSRKQLDQELEIKFWRTGVTGVHAFYKHPFVVAHIESSGWKYKEFKSAMIRECALSPLDFL